MPRRAARPTVRQARAELEQVLRFLGDDRDAAFFASPVDPVRDQAPNYAAVIENPMDLSTVAAKLELGAYDGSDDAFAADVHLIFDNAMLYNANPAHIVHEAARRLKNAFDECMNRSETETPSFAVRNAQRLENLCNLLNIKRFEKPVRDVEETVDDEVDGARGDAKLRALQSRRRECEAAPRESAALEPPSAEKRPHPYDFDEPAESTPPPLHKKPRSAALGEEPAAPHGEKRPRDEDDPAEIDRDAKKQHGQSTPASVAHVGQVSAIPGSFWI
ncbi:peptidase [Aureococcus anophagefferens]|nr:peptidase [Aureococcus anophagefferens]